MHNNKAGKTIQGWQMMPEIFKSFDKWWDAVGYFLTLKTQRKDAAFYGWHARDGEVAELRRQLEENEGVIDTGHCYAIALTEIERLESEVKELRRRKEVA